MDSADLVEYVVGCAADFYTNLHEVVQQYRETGELPEHAFLAPRGLRKAKKGKGSKKKTKATRPPTAFNLYVKHHIVHANEGNSAEETKGSKRANDNFKNATQAWKALTAEEKKEFKQSVQGELDAAAEACALKAASVKQELADGPAASHSEAPVKKRRRKVKPQQQPSESAAEQESQPEAAMPEIPDAPEPEPEPQSAPQQDMQELEQEAEAELPMQGEPDVAEPEKKKKKKKKKRKHKSLDGTQAQGATE